MCLSDCLLYTICIDAQELNFSVYYMKSHGHFCNYVQCVWRLRCGFETSCTFYDEICCQNWGSLLWHIIKPESRMFHCVMDPQMQTFAYGLLSTTLMKACVWDEHRVIMHLVLLLEAIIIFIPVLSFMYKGSLSLPMPGDSQLQQKFISHTITQLPFMRCSSPIGPLRPRQSCFSCCWLHTHGNVSIPCVAASTQYYCEKLRHIVYRDWRPKGRDINTLFGCCLLLPWW